MPSLEAGQGKSPMTRVRPCAMEVNHTTDAPQQVCEALRYVSYDYSFPGPARVSCVMQLVMDDRRPSSMVGCGQSSSRWATLGWPGAPHRVLFHFMPSHMT
jgi:hypothetical protein